MGISTLIIFIVIVLIATVAAVVLLNAANALKNQAQITQKESQAKFTRRLEIDYVYGFVDKNAEGPYGRGVIRYLLITARVPPGGEPVRLLDTVLQFSTENVVKVASFIDSDADNETSGDPCEKTDSYVRENIFGASWLPEHNEAYNKFHKGEYYTVAWIICNGEEDDRTVFPGQIINIYYAPPNGLFPGEAATLAILVNNGGRTEIDFTVPEILRGSVVRLYPP